MQYQTPGQSHPRKRCCHYCMCIVRVGRPGREHAGILKTAEETIDLKQETVKSSPVLNNADLYRSRASHSWSTECTEPKRGGEGCRSKLRKSADETARAWRRASSEGPVAETRILEGSIFQESVRRHVAASTMPFRVPALQAGSPKLTTSNKPFNVFVWSLDRDCMRCKMKPGRLRLAWRTKTQLAELCILLTPV